MNLKDKTLEDLTTHLENNKSNIKYWTENLEKLQKQTDEIWREIIERNLIKQFEREEVAAVHCIVFGCKNNSGVGGPMIGNICAPCHAFLTTNKWKSGHSQLERNVQEFIDPSVKKYKSISEDYNIMLHRNLEAIKILNGK